MLPHPRCRDVRTRHPTASLIIINVNKGLAAATAAATSTMEWKQRQLARGGAMAMEGQPGNQLQVASLKGLCVRPLQYENAVTLLDHQRNMSVGPWCPSSPLNWFGSHLFWSACWLVCRSSSVIQSFRSTLKFGLSEICLLRSKMCTLLANKIHGLGWKLYMCYVRPQSRENFDELTQLLASLKGRNRNLRSICGNSKGKIHRFGFGFWFLCL